MVNPNDNKVKVEFAVKKGVHPFGPQIPQGQNFKLDSNLGEFFFSKCMFF